jgi:D-glucosaminate-6-phosphate ammonia-lyase
MTLRPADLGLRPVVNAAATLTALGGSVMAPNVLDAMAAASTAHLDLAEASRVVGAELAAATRNEAAIVTSGAAAGMVLAILAATAGADPAEIARLPRHHPRPVVVMHCAHRIPYDRAIEFAGAEIRQIGNALQTFEFDLSAALDERVVAVLYVAGAHLARGALSLEDTLRIAHGAGVPVIVDAAAQLPPLENLWQITGAGADLVIFSGGKALGGPQSTGLVVGRADLIEAIRANGSPNQRLARALKVDKEELFGLLAAVTGYLARDHEADTAAWEATCSAWISALDTVPGLRAQRMFPNEAGQPVPRVHVAVDPACGSNAQGLVRYLWEVGVLAPHLGELPARVAVLPDPPDGFYLTPDTLAAGEAELVVTALTEAMAIGGHRG